MALTAAQVWYVARVYPERVLEAEAQKEYERHVTSDDVRAYWDAAAGVLNELASTFVLAPPAPTSETAEADTAQQSAEDRREAEAQARAERGARKTSPFCRMRLELRTEPGLTDPRFEDLSLKLDDLDLKHKLKDYVSTELDNHAMSDLFDVVVREY